MAGPAPNLNHPSRPARDRPEALGLRAGARAIVDSPCLALWAGFLILFPLYVFDSGLPQPADAVAIVLVSSIALDRRYSIAAGSVPAARLLLLFVFYTLIVNLTWAIANHNFSLSAQDGHLLYSFFYIFNGALFLTALALHHRYGDRFLAATAAALLASVLIQVVGSVALADGDEFRQSLWFNNPNQLGYYALLSATIFALIARRLPLAALGQSLFFAATAYLAVLSLSRAAMLAVIILAALTYLTRPRTLIITTLFLVGAGTVWLDGAEHMDRFEHRMSTDGTALDHSLGDRGYDRILNHKEYWLVGAGEGVSTRFDSALPGELHSTFGNIFFSYGLLGFALFALFLYALLRRLKLRVLLLLLPSAIYGLSHNGARFTLAWIMLATLLCLRLSDSSRSSHASPTPDRSRSAAASLVHRRIE